MEMAAGTNIVFLWSAATNFMPVVGAVLSDSCLVGFGRLNLALLLAFWCLYKACINVESPATMELNKTALLDQLPQIFCTVEQVEELKALIKEVPIWSSGIIISKFRTKLFSSYTGSQAYGRILVSSQGAHCSAARLEKIDENGGVKWALPSCVTPETPTEAMEFLARSWSVSAMELSKALSTTNDASNSIEKLAASFSDAETQAAYPNSNASREPIIQPMPDDPVSPRVSDGMKDMILLHQVFNPEFLTSQQPYKSIISKTLGKGAKDQKQRKKTEARIQSAQLHAAVSVAGVASAVAALAASIASPENISEHRKIPTKIAGAIASASALVASHCIEIAEDLGADHVHILKVVHSAISAKSNGDIMALTAGAATALRGASILRARLERGNEAMKFALSENRKGETHESQIMAALNHVSRGGELLKRTRKGALHWKQLSFNVNSNWQVVAKMKSKHIAGTFTKKKKCVVIGLMCDVRAWAGREREGTEPRAYFGIISGDRVIEFECSGKDDMKIWTVGIKHMLNCRAYITSYI